VERLRLGIAVPTGNSHESRMNLIDQPRHIGGRYWIVADISGDDLCSQFDKTSGSHAFTHRCPAFGKALTSHSGSLPSDYSRVEKIPRRRDALCLCWSASCWRSAACPANREIWTSTI